MGKRGGRAGGTGDNFTIFGTEIVSNISALKYIHVYK